MSIYIKRNTVDSSCVKPYHSLNYAQLYKTILAFRRKYNKKTRCITYTCTNRGM